MRLISLALIFLALTFSIAFGESRIEKPGDPNFRCSKEELLQSECDDDRMQAIKRHCITSQELEELKLYRGCPVCLNGKYRGWCPVGCFVRGTKILVWDLNLDEPVSVPVEEIVGQRTRYQVAALRADASLAALKFDYIPIRLTTVGPEHEPLVMITTNNQRSLGITSTHAVPLSNGTLVAAESLRVGDELLAEDGSVDVITGLSRPNTEDDVFNLSVETNIDHSHLIIAEGLLIGDQFLQGSKLLKSVILK